MPAHICCDVGLEELADMDTNRHRCSGKVCTTSNGKPIVWRGHACEGGANLTPGSGENFCLWTRCGSADVPAGAAHEGTLEEVDCPKCKSMSASQ